MNVRQVSPGDLAEHPKAHLVPSMRDEEWAEFYADVVFRGVVSPLEVTADGIVLDGRHRLKAARQAGLSTVPVIDAHLGAEADDVYMLKAAVLRRHLTDGQRAAMSVLWAQEHRQPAGRPPDNSAPRGAELDPHLGPARAEATSTFRVSRKQHDVAAAVLKYDPALFERVHAGEVDLREARRTVERQRREESLPAESPLPSGVYDLILADPPWRYEFAESENRAIENQYPTMDLDTICALEVQPLIADDAVLLLWSTPPKLAESLIVLEAWGFEYRSCLVWIKDAIGMGYWARQRHELLLIGRRGAFSPPPPELRPDSVIEAPRGAHSAKPDEAYQVIESAYPAARKLELFSRRPRPGWQAWGNEAVLG